MSTLTKAAVALRVVFLDFDGVLITPRAQAALTLAGGHMFEPDPVALGVVRKVCDAGVRIVVSSDRRRYVQQCRQFLERHELTAYLHRDWMTPDTSRDVGGVFVGAVRGEEIALWLKAHPEVRSYRILDDARDMLPAQMPFLISCDTVEGIAHQGVEDLLTWAGVDGRGPKEAA